VPTTIQELLTRKLESIGTIVPEARDCLSHIHGEVRHFDAHQDVVSDGQRPHYCTMVLSGLVCRYKMLSAGTRQIMSFHLPGDIPDLQSLFLKTMDHSIGALVPSELVLIPHRVMLDVVQRCPALGNLLWRDTLIDAAVFREWMIGIGRRSAYVRIAHVLCEMIVRMRALRLQDGPRFDLPITQTDIADALGLSNVHVSRTIRELQGNGLLQYRPGSITVLEWEGLKEAGDFDPTYLHLNRAEAA
jgi:CRP-like cAMP-binding protein